MTADQNRRLVDLFRDETAAYRTWMSETPGTAEYRDAQQRLDFVIAELDAVLDEVV